MEQLEIKCIILNLSVQWQIEVETERKTLFTRTVHLPSTKQLELLRLPCEWRWLLWRYSIPLATSVMNDSLKLLSSFTSSFINMSCIRDAPIHKLVSHLNKALSIANKSRALRRYSNTYYSVPVSLSTCDWIWKRCDWNWVADEVVVGVVGVWRERKQGETQKHAFLQSGWYTFIISRIFTRGRYSLIV